MQTQSAIFMTHGREPVACARNDMFVKYYTVHRECGKKKKRERARGCLPEFPRDLHA